MKRLYSRTPILFALAIVMTSLAGRANAAEPVKEFLDGLRERGYYDLAIEYLERMKTDPLVSAEMKQTISYEQGITLIAGSRAQRDPKLREQQLDEAQAKLKDFIAKYKNLPQATSAISQLANVLVERGRMNVAKGKKPTGLDRKLEYMKTASKQFDEARAVFKQLEDDIRAKLKKIPKHIDEKSEPQLHERREKLRAEYVQAQLVGATILYEKGETSTPGTKRHTKIITEAAAEYEAVHKKYRNRLAGLYAKMYQAKCELQLKHYDEALTLYSNLFEQPDDPAPFRTLKTKSMTDAIECWLASKKTNYEDALFQTNAWLNKGRPSEIRTRDWLELRMAMARLYKEAASATAAKTPKHVSVKKNQRMSRDLAKFVAEKGSGDPKKDALSFLALLGGEDPDEDQPVDPKNFAEAKAAGKKALEKLQAANVLVKVLTKKMTKTKKTAKREEMQDQIDDARRTITTKTDEALNHFRLALRLAGPDTEIEEINVVRYFMGFLYYSEKDYFAAAVISEFITRNYPDSIGSRQCATIAMASYLKIYDAAKEEPDTTFEVSRVESIAEFIATRWPEQSESDGALITLINITIQQGRLEDAKRYLAKIPVESPKRGEAELKTGQAMWSKYLRASASLSNAQQGDNPPSQAEVDAQKAEMEKVKAGAQQTLANGIERMKTGAINSTLTSAVLSLSQIYVDTEKPQEAIKLIEDPKIGALTLVMKKHPAAERPGYSDESYKTALRAYISGLPHAKSAAEGEALMGKAEDVMESLDKALGNSPEGKKKLIAIYISLARDLERQLEIATPDAKKALSEGFEKFLARVGDNSTDFKILNWVAETFYSLGSSFDSGKGAVSKEASNYYQKAVSRYGKILEQPGLDPKLRIQAQMRLATTKKRMGDYEEAIKLFKQILKQNNSMINVQIEAANTYQEWGKDDPKNYQTAISGRIKNDKGKVLNEDEFDFKKKRFVIWGWAYLAKITAKQMRTNPKYKSTFHQARYNLALCRYSHALRQSNADRPALLQKAKRDIKMVVELYDVGGPAWETKYDDLMKQIQRSLKEPVEGIAPYKPRKTTVSSR